MGRPPVQHHKHIISFDDKTIDVLEDIQSTWMKTRIIGAVGEASEGILSNPSLAFLVSGGILAAVGSAVGVDAVRKVTEYFGSLQNILEAKTPEEKQQAVNNTANALTDIINFFSPIDIPKV